MLSSGYLFLKTELITRVSKKRNNPPLCLKGNNHEIRENRTIRFLQFPR